MQTEILQEVLSRLAAVVFYIALAAAVFFKIAVIRAADKETRKAARKTVKALKPAKVLKISALVFLVIFLFYISFCAVLILYGLAVGIITLFTVWVKELALLKGFGVISSILFYAAAYSALARSIYCDIKTATLIRHAQQHF